MQHHKIQKYWHLCIFPLLLAGIMVTFTISVNANSQPATTEETGTFNTQNTKINSPAAACEQYDFGQAGLQYFVYSNGRSWNFTAENDMVVNTIETKSVLASTGGTFNIQVKINDQVEASWSQYINNSTYQAYTKLADVNIELNTGDTITYFIYGGTSSTPVGGITGPNYVKLCGAVNSNFGVSATYPLTNSLSIAPNSLISTTFNLPLNFSTVNTSTFMVRGSQTGSYTGTYSPGSVIFNAAQNFKPGEHIRVTLSKGIETITGTVLKPFTWDFWTAVEGGSAYFVNSGQELAENVTWDVDAGDLDGDGDIDIFAANGGYGQAEPNRIWLNNGSGFFNLSSQSLGNAISLGVDLGDLDNDGDLDAFIANEGVNKVWFNDGLANFTDSGQNLGNTNSNVVELGDLDGDGDLDALVGDEHTLMVWLNNGSGMFTENGQDNAVFYARGVALGDLDNDGDLDVYSCNNDSNSIWFNDGSGQLSDSGQSLGNNYCYEVALGDLDGDHDLDAVTANFDWPDGPPDKVWLNDGNGYFSDSGQNLEDESSLGVALGDLDADGDLDVFITGNSFDGIRVWINDGSGQLSNTGQSISNIGSESVALADFDADGDLDAYISNLALGGQPNMVWFNTTQYQIFLPLVVNNLSTAETPPDTPVLASIENGDGNGAYTVSWTTVSNADGYILEEDDNPSFSSPAVVYSGAGTTFNISGRGVGSYYYRVNANNTAGISSWSNTQAVSVSVVASSQMLYLCGLSTLTLSETNCPGITINLVGALDEAFAIDLTGDIQGTEYGFDLYMATLGGSSTAEASIILEQSTGNTILASKVFVVTNNGGSSPYSTILYQTAVAGIDPVAHAGDRLVLQITNTGGGALILQYGGKESSITIPAYE